MKLVSVTTVNLPILRKYFIFFDIVINGALMFGYKTYLVIEMSIGKRFLFFTCTPKCIYFVIVKNFKKTSVIINP